MTENQFTSGVSESQMFYAPMTLWFYNSVQVLNCEIVDSLFFFFLLLFISLYMAGLQGRNTRMFVLARPFRPVIELIHMSVRYWIKESV